MEAVHPGNVVNSVQHLARGANAERVDIRAAQRAVDERAVGATINIEDPVRYEKIAKDANGRIVTGGRVAGYDVDSDEAQQIVKNINTQTDLKISRWSEIAGYMRWATLGLMGSGFAMIATKVSTGVAAATVAGTEAAAAAGFLSTMSAAAGAIGTVVLSAPFLLLMGTAAVVAVGSLIMTQHVQKMRADRFMDVQGYMQERGATKIGKQVAQAIGKEPIVERSDGKRWQEVVTQDVAEVQGRGV